MLVCGLPIFCFIFSVCAFVIKKHFVEISIIIRMYNYKHYINLASIIQQNNNG